MLFSPFDQMVIVSKIHGQPSYLLLLDCMLKQHCSNFRMPTAIFLGVQIFTVTILTATMEALVGCMAWMDRHRVLLC